MAAKNVAKWLLGDAMIDLVTHPVSHGMKLWEFIPDAGTSISLRHDLPSHLCWGTIEKGTERGKFGGNTFAASWLDQLPRYVQEHIREAAFGRFMDTLPQDEDTRPSRPVSESLSCYWLRAHDLRAKGQIVQLGSYRPVLSVLWHGSVRLRGTLKDRSTSGPSRYKIPSFDCCNTHRPVLENQTADATIGVGAPSYATY
ncbi:hypothetical protein JCGZ_24236 [Jatropha curcas]|uniref:Aminotransferase-like plant mobile domain-containing protein n=1 Tax=Jatropha curcas TaxID=180498 RepID=A0A067LFN8_JATCU|nr:hypothetical protein JCGZ_24236 [Jatropha curcas]